MLKMVFSIQSSMTVTTKKMLSKLQLPEEESCGMIDCPTENRMGSQTELDSNSRCICPRKRKEHDDVSEQDVKFSKSSPLESPVLSFMKKWTETPLTPENLMQETLKEQKSSKNEHLGAFSWMQRQRHDSFKENEPMQQEEQVEKSFTINGRFTVCEKGSSSLSEKHFESNYHLPEKRSSKSSPRKSRSKQVSKKLSVLKMKIEHCEEEFERKMGYRPSHADKMKDEELSNLMSEQTKLKQELKEIKETGDDSPRKKSLEAKRTVEQERDQIVLNLSNTRLRSGRPFELTEMTSDQIREEKLDMQSQLLDFEKEHGHPLNKADKEVMSNLYERYRLVKRQCRRSSSELVPIPEEESIALTLASPKHRMSADFSDKILEIQQEDEFVTISEAKTLVFETEKRKEEENTNEENWHTMSFGELNTHLKRLRDFKKKFKRNINDFEDTFQATSGRKAQGEDKLPLENTYLMYRVTKSKIKLIKALIEKHGK